ncbi:MFS transporter [Candidatus Nitrosacidococcus tergens]|uniref:Putative sugar transporter of the major facilitator superfamily (MFS) n=1 Tax=Candidatus Nitrosacidococcus tergens TaxID=553981 RepID=A0A7G1QA31_9GAMM|nr:MFS transporter [Candidatus Nitrosacidococcus tergens]CAB1276418.1 putative sugar transporter of the major facilitator superfamily (MFS) [Candidatus Nitrosacidococcus tergens]
MALRIFKLFHKNLPVTSLIPARLDRLPWTRFHWTVVVGLGVAWVLDGLGAQVVASAGFQQYLHMSPKEVGLSATIYLAGQVIGALFFGRLSDKLGRRKLFIITLGIYLVGSTLAGVSFFLWQLFIAQFISGLGIGGEHTAINSAIDELIPSKYRGRASIAINGTYWGGAALGASANLFLLNPNVFSDNIGWRISFFLGPVLGLMIVYLRRHIPESPRWMVGHGYKDEAEKIVNNIESEIQSQGYTLSKVPKNKALEIFSQKDSSVIELIKLLFKRYPRQTFVSFSMMVTQSILYNSIFFSYALVLQNFYHTDPSSTQYYFFPFAIGNLVGPLVLGKYFDTVGRRKMIFITYSISGTILIVSAILFYKNILSAAMQTTLWSASFFFASAAASSAYLTVSEIFPLNIRSQAISYFFSIAQLTGAIAPSIFGLLINSGIENLKDDHIALVLLASGEIDRGPLVIGYLFAAGIMILGGLIALAFGYDAEQKSLEEII